MKWQAPDSHQKLPPRRHDDHRMWPGAPWVLIALGAAVIACAWLGWIIGG